jgi:endonuclease YncB( thermonuclease family)
VINENNLNVNLDVVRNGYAMTYYLKNNPECFYNRQKYLLYEDVSKHSQLNIWSDPNFIPPWKYRQLKKNKNKNSQIEL